MPEELRVLDRGRVLVVAPHFDDEVIACGGTLIQHKRIGSEVAVVFLTDSGGLSQSEYRRKENAALRKKETEAVAETVGYEIAGMLDHLDGRLPASTDLLSKQLVEILKSWKPDQIICPFPTDGHEDHQAAAAAVATAARRSGFKGTIWAYELWSTLWPNALVDITNAVEEKRQAIHLYASQQNSLDYASAILGLNRYRGLPVKIPYCEAFFVCRGEEFIRLVDGVKSNDY